MPILWAEYSTLKTWQLSAVIAAGIVGFVALGLAIAFTPGRAGTPDPLLGYATAASAPVLFTTVVVWANSTSLTRLGVSENGLVLTFPHRAVEVSWALLGPPSLGVSKAGYFFQFYWKDGPGKIRTFAPDPVSAKYILDHPSCPRWKMPEEFTRVLEEKQGSPSSSVRVHFE